MSERKSGRKEPYTERGIKQARCMRCGAVASQQWQVCAVGNRWHAICRDCDIALNRLVLEFMRIDNWRELIAQYARRYKRRSA